MRGAALADINKPVTDPRLILRNSLPVNLSGNPILELDDILLDIIPRASSSRAAGSRSIVQSEMLGEKVTALTSVSILVYISSGSCGTM